MTTTRREFLKGLIGAAGLALAGPLVNGCAGLEEVMKETKDRFGYNTIAHDFLDIEGKAGFRVTASDYLLLDEIIDDAKERIDKIKLDKPFAEYEDDEAIAVLEKIDDVLKDKKITYVENELLSRGFQTKKLDCDNCSVIYLSVAEVVGLPLKAVNLPEHMFVRWYFDDGCYLNWETMKRDARSDDYYKKLGNLSESSIKTGYFLKGINKKKVYAEAYNGIGIVLRQSGEYEKAIKNYDKALKLNPHSSLAYNNKGFALGHLERYGEAIECFDKALEICPGYERVIINKKKAERLKMFKDLKNFQTERMRTSRELKELIDSKF